MPTYRLYLMVYIGKPTDDGHNRHVALFFESPDISYYHITYHVKKVGILWEMERVTVYNALNSINAVGKVDLGNITIDLNELHQIMDGVQIINNPAQGESNCQIWLEKAMLALKQTGYLTGALYNRGLNGMVDFVSEAL